MPYNNETFKGITIKFAGDTTQLGAALRNIDKEAKTVNSELTEINKSLKLDPKNVDLMRQKFTKVSEAIEATKKRLEILKEAKKQADEQFEKGEIKESAYKQLEAEISKAENALKRFKNEAKATAEKVKNELSSAVDKLAGDVKKISVATAGIITAFGGITMSAATTADELITLSKITGLTTDELQRFQYASSLIDVSTETLQGSLKKLVRNMQSAADGSGKAYEAFDALGIAVKDSSGELRNNEDVFYDVIDALGQVENATQRDAYAMDIFGKSAQDLNPLIIAGSDALKEYGDQADRMGLIFDEKTLGNLNEAKDKIDVAKQQLEGMKILVGSELVSSFDSLFGGVDKLLKAVQQAKEDGTLKEIADGITTSLKLLIDVVGAASKFIYNFRKEIVMGTAALIGFKTVISIANLVMAAAKALQVFKAAQDAATASQIAFNSAAMANPYALVVAGLVAVCAALSTFVITSDSATQSEKEYREQLIETAKKSNEAIQSYNELADSIERSTKARENKLSDTENEYDGYLKLVETLYDLNAQTNITKESKAQMLDIIHQLNEAIPNLNIVLDQETGHLITQREEIEKLINTNKEYQFAIAAGENRKEVASEIVALEKKYNDLLLEREKYAPSSDVRAMLLRYQNDIETLPKVKDDKEADERLATFEALNQEITDLEEKLEELYSDYDYYGEVIEDYSDSTAKASESTETLSDKLAKNAETYETSKSRMSSYKSELSSLLDILKAVNSGTAYSTSQILDLIEKYPQLANAVKLTADGYTIEAASIEELVRLKADMLLLSAQEAEQAAMNDYVKAAVMLGAGLKTRDDLEQAKKTLEDARAYTQNIETIIEDIKNGNIKQGSTVASSTSSSITDTADYWKQAAEAEIAEAEHLYKMGEISAEEYYRRLEDINRRYYENRAEYLNEYNKLAETVYSGLKKLEDEQISNTQNLIDRINEVRRAREQLENAENQKVSVYSSAAGFHAERNSGAIETAAQSLQSAQFNLAKLLQSKFNMKIELPDLSGVNLRDLIPDLSGIKLPQASTAGNKQTTVNYQAGNIYISGNADSATVEKLRRLMQTEMKQFFDEYLGAYLDEADRDRQTGGD